MEGLERAGIVEGKERIVVQGYGRRLPPCDNAVPKNSDGIVQRCSAPLSGDDRFFSMADSAASSQSRTPRNASAKRRATPVPTDTETRLARAARSAQRLAQLSDVVRDDNTLDLFPDDPTRATLETMNIDVRQGTLHGFELPEGMLAAVGALDRVDNTGNAGASGDAPAEARAVRRAPRTVKINDAHALGAAQSSPLEREGGSGTFAGRSTASSSVAAVAAGLVAEDRAIAPSTFASKLPSASASASTLAPASAAASVARSVTALRQLTDAAASLSSSSDDAASASGQAIEAPQHVAEPDDLSADLPRVTPANVAGLSAEPAIEEPRVGAEAASSTVPSAVEPAHDAVRAGAAATHVAATAPELDRARATAFADTIDALYGVIADQRRAATDHSRRMKWMLSIVVGALLATVAIGITQTVLLMRLTRETTSQQRRIEQMMQTQQAAMTNLLDAHRTMADMPAAAPAPAAPSVAARQPQTLQTPQADANPNKRSLHAQHSHKAKATKVH